MTVKFTGGEWFANRQGYSTVYIEARIGGGMLQEVAACGPTQGGQLEQEANACLIAAAPELLGQLTDLLAMCERQDDFNDDGDGGMLERARAAIAKATGAA